MFKRNRKQWCMRLIFSVIAGTCSPGLVAAQDMPEPPGLDWLMKHVFVSAGERYPNGVVIRFWKVL